MTRPKVSPVEEMRQLSSMRKKQTVEFNCGELQGFSDSVCVSPSLGLDPVSFASRITKGYLVYLSSHTFRTENIDPKGCYVYSLTIRR